MKSVKINITTSFKDTLFLGNCNAHVPVPLFLRQSTLQELMEKDILDAKEAAMAGKELTTGQEVVKPGETVDQFIQRTWK